MPSKKLSIEEMQQAGISISGSRMENGEYRFRLMRGQDDDGSGYIMTIMPENTSGWQKSHYHKGVMETYIVQSGWIGYVEQLPGQDPIVQVCREREIFTSSPDIPHNVYMPAGAVIHTVKHGRALEGKDWHSSPEMDLFCAGITEEMLRQL